MSLKNSSDTIGNRTRDQPVCSVVIFCEVKTKSMNIFDMKFVLERDKCIQWNHPDESVVLCP